MKYYSLSLLFLCSVLLSSAQKEQSLGVFESDTTWLEEIIPFPIHFAPEIKYQGFEDLRFAKQWRDSNHEAFWSYTFAWHITSIEEFDENILETNIKYYYDGLMTTVNKKKDFEVPESTVQFVRANGDSSDIDYIGKLQVYDSFNLEEMINLNMRVKVYHCQQNTSTTVVFRISPQNFNHSIWEQFKDVKLKLEDCY